MGAMLVRAARMLERPGATFGSAAADLGYSSSQSFSRAIRLLTRRTPSAFFAEWTAAALLAQFRDELVAPHANVLRCFSPRDVARRTRRVAA
jgi:AraC-like DNA-binding protein